MEGDGSGFYPIRLRLNCDAVVDGEIFSQPNTYWSSLSSRFSTLAVRLALTGRRRLYGAKRWSLSVLVGDGGLRVAHDIEEKPRRGR